VDQPILAVTQTDQLLAIIVRMVATTPQLFLNVIKLIQSNQNVTNVTRINQNQDVDQEEQPVEHAHQSNICTSVTKKLSHAFRQSNKEISNKPVQQNVVTRPLKSFLVPGEVLRQRKAQQQISIWVKSI